MRPFLRWIGSKRKHIEQIKKLMPKNMNTYYEPFVGGGSILLGLKPTNAVINDVNKELMAMFRVMADKDQYDIMISTLKTLDLAKTPELYYKIRNQDREPDWAEQSDLTVATRFLFLNRTNYRGIYRCNPKGYNNTPVDHHRASDKFKLLNMKELTSAHDYLTSANISILNTYDYSSTVKNATEGDFVLIDPPYDYYDEASDYNNVYYGNINFSKADQINIWEMMNELTEKGVKVIAFNFDTPFIKELYDGYTIIYPDKKLTLRKKGSSEVMILNYNPEVEI